MCNAITILHTQRDSQCFFRYHNLNNCSLDRMSSISDSNELINDEKRAINKQNPSAG